MNVQGKHFRTLWRDGEMIRLIDQRHLPHQFVIEEIREVNQMVVAIREMHVRGAIVIGAAAGYGMALAAQRACASTWDQDIESAAQSLLDARPTAVNLRWGVDVVRQATTSGQTPADKIRLAWEAADQIAADEIERSLRIGRHGVEILKTISRKKNGRPVNILTHCNAGWLACVDHGTATAPIYEAFNQKIPIHVWVDETRPRNQGMLTAWELGEQ